MLPQRPMQMDITFSKTHLIQPQNNTKITCAMTIWATQDAKMTGKQAPLWQASQRVIQINLR